MNFKVFSENQMKSQEYSSICVPHILISIFNPGDRVPIFTSKLCKSVLELDFHDVEDITKDKVHFDMSMADKIIDFVNKNLVGTQLIVIHCQAGVSRSVAVASALSKILNHVDDDIFSKGSPNMLVYLSILEAYFSDKHAKSKWSKIYYARQDGIRIVAGAVIARLIDYIATCRDKEK